MASKAVPLVGGFYADDARPWSSQDVCNWIPVLAEQPNTLSPAMYRTPPGLRPFVAVDGAGPVRGARNVEGRLLVVMGNQLYQISNTGVAIPRGTIPGVGPVQISHNQQGNSNQVIIVNGSAGYIYDTATLDVTRITDAGYPGAKTVDYLASYFLQVEPSGLFWFHSDLADGFAYNTLDRYESEAKPDRLVAVKSSQLEAVAFNQTTIEFFTNTGAATGTFQSKGIVIETGCASANGIVELDNSLMWLDNKGVFQRMEGYGARPISTRVLERAIAGYDWSSAIAFVWEDKGHKVAYWTFRDGFTVGYDVTTGLWHRRASYGMDRWRLSCLVNWNGRWIGGDFRTGKLYELDWDYPYDGQDPMVRRAVTGALHNDQRRMTVPSIELVFDTGGPSVEVADFPIQPVGPSLSGSAPDGVAGITYADFDYTATAGDASLSTFTLTSGTLPTGLGPLSTPATLGGGTPTLPGSYPLGLRLTDAAGLYDDHSDTIVIRVPWFGVSQDGPSTVFGVRSPGGLIWQGDLEPQLGGTGVFSGDGLVVQVQTDEVNVSDDFGATFDAATGIDAGVTVLVSGDYAAGAYFVRSNGGAGPSPEFDDQQCYRSADGYAYTRIELPSNLRAISKFIEFDGSVFGFGDASIGGNTCVSTDGGVTFDATLLTCFDTNIDANDAATDGVKMIVVGTTNTLSVTTDGSSFTELTSPFAGTDDILLSAWSADRWVIVNAGGEIAHSATGTNGSWTIAAYTIPVLPNDIDGYEGRFVIACEDGIMVVSDGGTVFSSAASDFPGSSNVTGVSAYRPAE